MQLIDGTLIVSATDLVGFLECDHLVTLELARTRGEIKKPFRDDPQLKLLQERGYAHERLYIAQLEAAGRTVVEMTRGVAATPAELRAAHDETVEAMRAGTDVIFQATFFDGRWRGHPDFLLRRNDRPSVLGEYSYDIADTKLAKRVKAAAIVQMCVYADLLHQAQGIPPETIAVVTGDRAAHIHQLADYAAYYRAAKARFEARIDPAAPMVDTYPEPVDHCRVCSWWPMCIDRRRADDHLSLVANITRSNRRRLVADGVDTLAELAELGDEAQVAKLPPRILERLRHQAALQLGYRRDHVLRYELIPPSDDVPGQGLAALPEPAPLDVFFDIEADPWALDDGLEYLLGWAEIVKGEPVYHAIWAHDRAGEKAAFESFVDLVVERYARDPRMHVYHYGGYETGALKRLMQRHATREDEVDRLLRGRTLVNLYDHVVRSGIRASVESYSIKKIEKFYLPEREGGITDAGFSVVEYERWMETGDPAILDAIAAYNRDDCVSTWGCTAGSRRAGSRPSRSTPTASCHGPSQSTPSPRQSWRPPRPRPGPAKTRFASASRRIAPSGTTSSRDAGCSRLSSTGIAARPSPSGGTTTACSTPRSTTSSRTVPRSAGWSSSKISARSRTHASIAIDSIRPRRRSSMPAIARSTRQPARAPARSWRSIRYEGCSS